MKMEMKPRDIRLLVVAVSILIAVLMIRLAIIPAIQKYESNTLTYEEKTMQAEEMQKKMDDRPANEARITDGLATLKQQEDLCYENMENRQVDELVTGLALTHDLFPSHLSISDQVAELPAPYIYSPAGLAGVMDETEGADQTTAIDIEEAAAAAMEEASGDTEDSEQTELPGSMLYKVEASLTMSGSESNMRAFLNDIETNYPAIRVQSFEMSANTYMDTNMQPVTETQMNVVLGIYMYQSPMNDLVTGGGEH